MTGDQDTEDTIYITDITEDGDKGVQSKNDATQSSDVMGRGPYTLRPNGFTRIWINATSRVQVFFVLLQPFWKVTEVSECWWGCYMLYGSPLC